MKEKIQTVSVAVIAGVMLISAGWFVANQYFSMQNSLNQVVTYLNNQIQESKGVAPATK